jgi:drug/metabolite transporter (DMT)-like permease
MQYPTVRGDGATTYLYALSAAFIAMLGVVMAVMAILIGLMSPSYRAILEAIPGGIRRAMNPYFIVVFGSAVGALVALVGALGWPAMTWWAKVAALSVASGMVAWLLVGTAQLLIVTFNHGSDSATLEKEMASIRAAREQRLRERT